MAREERDFLARHRCHSLIAFLALWLSYCWWLSEWCCFDFGRYTITLRLLFCILHVLTVWRCFQYMIKLAFRLYRLSRRLQAMLPDLFMLAGLSLVLFLILTFVLHFKPFVREAFAIVD